MDGRLLAVPQGHVGNQTDFVAKQLLAKMAAVPCATAATILYHVPLAGKRKNITDVLAMLAVVNDNVVGLLVSLFMNPQVVSSMKTH